MSAPLGMENGNIPDTSISASSVYNILRLPQNVRLGLAASIYWTNNANTDKAPWIQVDLGSNYRVKAVQTKGNPLSGWVTWVEIIGVQFMTSDGTLAFVTDSNGQPMVFCNHL